MTDRQQTINTAIKHLRSVDPVMRRIIDQVGPFTLRPERDRFKMLVRAIISQQISTGAARSIRHRLEELAAPDGISSKRLVDFTVEDFRTAGLSSQKATYILELSQRVQDGRLRLNQIGRYSDECVIEQLTKVKGVGRWTAHMFLIFALGRLDVFPSDDLGVRTAIKNQYGFSELPDAVDSAKIAVAWSPFASVGSWYCWRTIDLIKGDCANATGYPS